MSSFSVSECKLVYGAGSSVSWFRQEAQLSPRDRAMRRVNEILPIATQQCRNYLYDKS